jgi:hypothetical protein
MSLGNHTPPLNNQIIEYGVLLFQATGKALTRVKLSRANFYKVADELKVPMQAGCHNCVCSECEAKLKLRLLGVAGHIEVRAGFDMPDNGMTFEWD